MCLDTLTFPSTAAATIAADQSPDHAKRMAVAPAPGAPKATVTTTWDVDMTVTLGWRLSALQKVALCRNLHLRYWGPCAPRGDFATLRMLRRAETMTDNTPSDAAKPILAGATKRQTALTAFQALTTERLTLRHLRPEDAEALHRLVNDWEVTRTLAELPYPYPRDLADEWIASTAAQLTAGTGYHLAITGHEGKKETLIGVVGLQFDANARVGRLGYWVGKAYWGHGVATEAAKRLTSWAFANLPVDRITAEVAEGNEPSVKVLSKIGFRPNGRTERKSLVHDKSHAVNLFEARRDDVFGKTEVIKGAEALASDKPLLLVVAAALVDVDGRILLTRRPEGKKMAGLWEFPGGKLNPGEMPEAALIRELKEELGIDVSAACLAPFAFASHDYDTFHLLMPLFICRRWKGTPSSVEGQALKWVRSSQLADYDMPPADKPLIPLLRDFL
jgi:8-oxo-dGTP diphosphatase